MEDGMPQIKLNNQSKNVFTNISSEQFREYYFPNAEVVAIAEPQWLAVSDNGHRILDGEGVCHYVPVGWIHLRWKVRVGAPHFVK